MGFDYFYGFVVGDTSQWQPNLFRNTTAIYPFQGHPGWNLTTAMADDAIQYMKQLNPSLISPSSWATQSQVLSVVHSDAGQARHRSRSRSVKDSITSGG
jgi:hypothetical protein